MVGKVFKTYAHLGKTLKIKCLMDFVWICNEKHAEIERWNMITVSNILSVFVM